MKKLYLNKVMTILHTIIAFILCSSLSMATGPSYVHSEIKPISMNEKGEILCKTRFTANEMGAYSPMGVEYGFCVISNNKIIEFKTKVIEPFTGYSDTGESNYWDEVKYWDEIFNSQTSQKQLEQIQKDILKEHYHFSSINADVFKIDSIMSINDFEKTKGVSLQNTTQKGLHNSQSEEYYQNKKIHLLYDFGNILLFNNDNDIDNNELALEYGAHFNYPNTINTHTNDKGEKISLGFEINKVTGVLIVE